MSLGKRITVLGCAFMVVAILFTVMVAGVDVRPVGPNGSSVGLAGLNSAFADAFGENRILYGFSEFGGYLALLTAAGFGALGIYQLIKRKSLFKVDYCILSMGVLFVVVGALYVMFDKFAINYRPVLEADGSLEPSFPSSHTLLAVCIFVPAIFAAGRVIKEKRIAFTVSVIFAFLTLVVVMCRLFSGVHWLSDMIGGGFYSLALVFMYLGSNLIYELR
ncbi:MAG: phosphatase PAP2 family protein [Lachnospiraceae bacterium]|nr:phosphatase PAP2 family protein [Lachnospiraceae bacterium]